MGRVPITVMGYHCERCAHEWIPRDAEQEPRVCPKCKSPYWNRPKKITPMSYEAFREIVERAMHEASAPQTWTELRTVAKLPQAFPNNQWVRRLEQDIGLVRERDRNGILHWKLGQRETKRAVL